MTLLKRGPAGQETHAVDQTEADSLAGLYEALYVDNAATSMGYVIFLKMTQSLTRKVV